MRNNIMVTLHEVITFLVSMQISISSLQTHNVNRCGRSRHLARKLSLRRKRSSPNVFEMAATETITSIILIKLIRVSLGTVRHPRRFKIVFFYQAEAGIRDVAVTGVQTCALPMSHETGGEVRFPSVGKRTSPPVSCASAAKSSAIFQLLPMQTKGRFPLSYGRRHEGESCHKMSGASSGTDAPRCCGTSRGV